MFEKWRFPKKVIAAMRSALSLDKTIFLWHGAVRSGKTISSIIAWIIYVRLLAPQGDLLMIGKTERTLKRNILDVIEKIIGSRNYSYHGSAGYITIFGREVLIVGANDEKAEGKIRGMTLAGAYGDEVTLWAESFFNQLLLRNSVPFAKIFLTTNPDNPFHWFKVLYLDRKDETDLVDFHFTLEDNPALGKKYLERIMAQFPKGSMWFKRFILGLWVAAEGAIYSFFNEEIHVIENSKIDYNKCSLYLSADYGTGNPTSVGLYSSEVIGKKNKVIRLRGFYYDSKKAQRELTDLEYIEKIDAWLLEQMKEILAQPDLSLDAAKSYIKKFVLDPSAASFRVALKKEGYRVKQADNSVLDGIRTQAAMLQAGTYKILKHPSNQQCIRDYSAYLWDKKAQEKGEDKPIKRDDHTKDEERYILHTLFGEKVGQSENALRVFGA